MLIDVTSIRWKNNHFDLSSYSIKHDSLDYVEMRVKQRAIDYANDLWTTANAYTLPQHELHRVYHPSN